MKNLKILYADDDFDVPHPEKHSHYCALLKALGRVGINPKLDIATTGAKVNELLEENSYDGLILDIMMPQGDGAPDFIKDTPFHRVGVAIAKRIADGGYKTSPKAVVILAATGEAGDREEVGHLCAGNNNWELMRKPALFKNIASFFEETCNG